MLSNPSWTLSMTLERCKRVHHRQHSDGAGRLKIRNKGLLLSAMVVILARSDTKLSNVS